MGRDDSWVLTVAGSLGLGVASALAALVVGGLVLAVVSDWIMPKTPPLAEGYGYLWVIMVSALCGVLVFGWSLIRAVKSRG